MRIRLFCHPGFLGSKSMGRHSLMIEATMRRLGHDVERWEPKAVLSRFPWPRKLLKWVRYIDQFFVFPSSVRWKLKNCTTDTLFVFSDQALGPWIPLVRGRPHIVHVMDFLAYRSALGHFPENPTSATGMIYQKWIASGFRKSTAFISISDNSRQFLESILPFPPHISRTIYLGLSSDWHPVPSHDAATVLSQNNILLPKPYLLNVGSGQWYKNRRGLLRAYSLLATRHPSPYSLILVGPPLTPEESQIVTSLPPGWNVQQYSGLDDRTLAALYSLAALFLFPSLEEGFGWPIAEAQACGCPVLTTGHAPMTEVGGEAALYAPRMRYGDDEAWADDIANRIAPFLKSDPESRRRLIEAGLSNVARFDMGRMIESYESAYRETLTLSLNGN